MMQRSIAVASLLVAAACASGGQPTRATRTERGWQQRNELREVTRISYGVLATKTQRHEAP